MSGTSNEAWTSALRACPLHLQWLSRLSHAAHNPTSARLTGSVRRVHIGWGKFSQHIPHSPIVGSARDYWRSGYLVVMNPAGSIYARHNCGVVLLAPFALRSSEASSRSNSICNLRWVHRGTTLTMGLL